MDRPKNAPDGKILADVSLSEGFVEQVAMGSWRSQPHVAQAFAQEIERLRAEVVRLKTPAVEEVTDEQR